MLKRKILVLLSLTLFSLPVFADVSLESLLNKIILQLRAEQWVVTKTALVNVSVNASVTDQGIEKIQSDVMQKLTQLSNASEWHIVSFDRQQDKSGLESIQMIAQARLPQSELSNLRSKAKTISKPGVTFLIDSVQFIPSNDELQQANGQLRNNLYGQAKSEIDTLNKMYPDQKFYLHEMNFVSAPIVPQNFYHTKTMETAALAPQAEAQLSVGNKQELQATVTIAAMPSQVATHLTNTK